MNDKIEGLVLRISDYKDNDQLLQVLTADFGILSLIGKSTKKITSKQHFFEASLYEFIIDYKDQKTIYSIHNAKLIKTYLDMNETKNFAYQNIFFEMIYKSKELCDENTYNNIKFVLENINEHNQYLLGSLFTSYMCDIHGISPNVDECVYCHKTQVAAISSKMGGFVCLDHLNGEKILSVDTLKKFRLIVKAHFKDYEVIREMTYNFNDFKLIVDFFIDNSSINLKSYDFYGVIA